MEEKELTNSTSPQQQEEQGVTFTELYRQMREKWRWFVLSVACCLAIGVFIIFTSTPQYTYSTEVMLKDSQQQNLTADFSGLGVSTLSSDWLNETFIMTSPDVMEHVVKTLDLNNSYTSSRHLRKVDLYKKSPVKVVNADTLATPAESYSFNIELNADSNSVTLSKFVTDGEKMSADDVVATFGEPTATPSGTFVVMPTEHFNTEPYFGKIKYAHTSTQACATAYSKMLVSSFSEDEGTIVTISITLSSKQKAIDILADLIDSYNLQWIADKNKTAIATSKFIDERLAVIETELGDVEDNITDFKRNNKLIDPESMAQLYISQSTENQKALNDLSQEIAIGRYIKKELSSGDLTNLLPVTAEIGGTNVQTLILAYNTLVNERNQKLETMPEDSPIIKNKTEAIKRTRQAILESVNAALEALDKRYKAISLIDANTQSNMTAAPGKAKYLMSEERKQKVKESLYLFLLQRREENELSQKFAVNNTRMSIAPHGEQTAPRSAQIMLLALAFGLAIPALLIYLREVTNTTVRSRRDIEDLPIPFLGEIPLNESQGKHNWLQRLLGRSANLNDNQLARQILVRPHKINITNEAFRMVRTNIDFMGSMNYRQEIKSGKTIMVVSLNAGSGKTFFSLNTAAIFAIKNKKVCLVDMDLRKGTINRNVGSPNKGLVDYLVGKNTNLDDLIVRNIEGIENFDILPEGLIPPNPTELLYSPNLEKLIDELRERYDYVIFDCPPVEIVADARLLNPYMDMTVFVMRSGLFEKRDIKVVRQFYESHRYNNLAIVLNGTDSVHGIYGSYGYGYGYGMSHKNR